MRRQVSIISVFSMLVSFGAAVVLCLQTPSLPVPPTWPINGFTQGGLELALFGVALLVGRRRLSLTGWFVGIFTLVAVRLLISASASYALAGFQSGHALALATERMGEFAPRAAAAVFSLMVTYPLRAFLPGAADRAQGADSAETEGRTSSDRALWVMKGDESLQVGGREEKPSPSPTVMTFASPEQYRGSIELPLRVLLAEIPARWLAPGSARYTESEAVSVPLALIVPQLRDAQVYLTFDELRQILPPHVLNLAENADSEGESTVVLLPLEEVVSQLPPSVLELPPSSPPAWAELPDPESVVFATV